MEHALFLGFGILMNGSTFAALQGRFSQELDLPGSGVIRYISWLALAGYVAAVCALRTAKRTRTCWIGFIIVTAIANTVISYPTFLLNYGAKNILIRDLISREDHALFEARCSVKIVSCSASYEEACIRVRKDQNAAEMASYAADLIEKQD